MYAYPPVKTIEQARRQAFVAERVQAMHAGSEYHWYDCGNGVYGVAKRAFSAQPDTAYTVELQPVSCDCPDFEKHGDFCKHTVYLWEQLDRQEVEAMCAAYEEEEAARAFMEACAIDGELRGSYGVCY
jgi:hypothetical protein